VIKLQCDHIICQPCFQYIITTNHNQQVRFQCPLDCEYIIVEKAIQFSTLEEYQSHLNISCTNDMCSWVGNGNDFKVHFEECPNKVMDCSNPNCDQKFIQSLANLHEKDCPYKEIKCSNCIHTYYQKDANAHKELCIVNLTMSCKNSGCTAKFAYNEKKAHYNKICEYQKIMCRISECKSTFLRKDLSQHNGSCEFNEKIVCTNANCYKVFLRKNNLKHRNECLYEFVSCEALSCKTKILRIDQEKHNSECENIKIKCPSKDCTNKFRRAYLTKHLSTCAHVLLRCKYCGEMYKRFLEVHHIKSCESKESQLLCELCGLNIGNHPQMISDHVNTCKQEILTCMKCGQTFIHDEYKHHVTQCPKDLVSCLYGCNVTIHRDEVNSHMEECSSKPMEACRYDGCSFKGSKTQCTHHEETCPINKENNCSIDFESITTGTSNSISTAQKQSTINYNADRVTTRLQKEDQNIKDYSYGRLVWEYETAGLQIADEALVEAALPCTPAPPTTPSLLDTNTTQYEGSILQIKSPKPLSPLRSPQAPYKRIGISKRSSPLFPNIETEQKIPNAFISNWKEFDELKSTLKLQEQEIVRLKHGSYNIQKSVELLQNEKTVLRNEVKYLRSTSQCFLGNKIVWEIDDFSCKLEMSRMQNLMIEANSPVFYTCNPGYKCMANVYMYYQSDSHRGLHLGFTILKGKYDNILSWPFNKKIQIEVLNQKKHKDGSSLIKVLHKLSIENASQPIEFDNDQQVIDFIFYEEIIPYVYNDCLFLQCSVIDTPEDNDEGQQLLPAGIKRQREIYR